MLAVKVEDAGQVRIHFRQRFVAEEPGNVWKMGRRGGILSLYTVQYTKGGVGVAYSVSPHLQIYGVAAQEGTLKIIYAQTING